MTMKKTSAPMVMDRERIAKYAAGIAQPDAEPAPLIVAALIIPTTGMMLGDIDVGDLNLARIVHGSIELTFYRLVRQGDTLTCVADFEGVEEKSSGSILKFAFDVRDQQDESVCRGTTGYFVRGSRKGGRKAQQPDASGEPAFLISETIAEGQSLLYAEGSGDVFPIHTSKSFAQSVGLPDVILHGMCTLAIAARGLVSGAASGDATKLRKLAVRFSKMVFHGDTLTTTAFEDGDGFRFVTTNQRGEPVLKDGYALIDAC